MQRDGGFPAAGRALHQQVLRKRMADHDVLLRLDGGDDLPQPVGGDAAQHALQICLLGDDAAVEQADQLPLFHGQHPFEGQLTLDAPVRRLIIHPADLAGVVQVGGGGTPVHHDGSQCDGIQHTPAAQIPGLRLLPGRREVQPGEVCLAGSHAQLPQTVQLVAEAVHGDLDLFVRILLHPHVHTLSGLRAGQGFDLGDLPVDGVAGLQEMKVLLLRCRMVRQADWFHFFPFPTE